MSQTERVFDILYQLSKSGGNITLKTIAEHYGVSTRQAARDIEYVRYGIMPDPENIIFDRKRRVYRLNDDVSILSRWREDMLVSFAVLRAMSGSAVGKNEIDNNLPLSMRNILSHIDYRVPVKSRGEDEVWLSVVFEAFEKDRSVVIHYRKTPGSEMEIRHADPLKLVNYQGFWYLFSYDRDRRALRTFRLSRAEKVLITDEPSLEHYENISGILGSSYGMFFGEEADDRIWYTMRFSGNSALRVSAEVWHDEQKSSWNSGVYELSFPAASPVEIVSRLLSFGPEAWPVAPKEFVQAYWDSVKRMAARISHL